MKSTGIVRKIDRFGRVVLPIELRRLMKVDVGDSLEIFTEGNSVVLRKYDPSCIFCGSMDKLAHLGEYNICPKCAAKIFKLHNED